MAEWSKALDLGSSLYGGVGSNPTTAIFSSWYSEFLSINCTSRQEVGKIFRMELSRNSNNCLTLWLNHAFPEWEGNDFLNFGCAQIAQQRCPAPLLL